MCGFRTCTHVWRIFNLTFCGFPKMVANAKFVKNNLSRTVTFNAVKCFFYFHWIWQTIVVFLQNQYDMTDPVVNLRTLYRSKIFLSQKPINMKFWLQKIATIRVIEKLGILINQVKNYSGYWLVHLYLESGIWDLEFEIWNNLINELKPSQCTFWGLRIPSITKFYF